MLSRSLFTVFTFFGITLSLSSFGFTVSNSGVEVGFSYTMEFKTVYPSTDHSLKKYDPKAVAKNHTDHLDGLFHSQEYAQNLAGYDPSLIEGFAGKKPVTIVKAEWIKKPSDSTLWLRYSAEGTMIVLKKVANRWFNGRREATVQLPLLQDFTQIYDGVPTDYVHFPRYKNDQWLACTDDHYTSPYDFSYFYNPYRKLEGDQNRCLALGRAPIAQLVNFKMIDQSPTDAENQTRIPKDKITAANENGRLVTFYFANGFNETHGAAQGFEELKKDYGWKDYSRIEKIFVQDLKFTKMESKAQFLKVLGDDQNYIDFGNNPITETDPTQRRFFSTYTKEIDGKLYVVRNALFYTENEISNHPRRGFPKFWKEAWENGDVIYYGGHSGDGFALSMNSMLKNLEKSDVDAIRFKKNKEQIVFFDSCSSYSYYVQEYVKHKPQTTSVITYGVVSLFPVALVTIEKYALEMMSSAPTTWLSLFKDIEHAQLLPMIKDLYSKEDVNAQVEKHQKASSYPNYLINVFTHP